MHSQSLASSLCVVFALCSTQAKAIARAPRMPQRLSCNSLYNDAIFYTFSDLADTIDTMTATPPLALPFFDPKTNREMAINCSSTIISDSGLILTAAHCFDQCKTDAAKKANGAKFNSNNELVCAARIGAVETDVTVKLLSKCNASQILAYELKKDQGSRTPQVNQPSNSNSKTRNPTEAKPQADCSHEDDIAIIEPKIKANNARCLPISFEEPKVGESLATQGYPAKTTRLEDAPAPTTSNDPRSNPVGKDAPGDQLTWSTGKRVENFTCEMTTHFNGNTIQEEASLFFPQLKNRFIQTTIDMVQGNSGGPLLNANGEVVGVASVVNPFSSSLNPGKPLDPRKVECRGSSFFAPLRNMKEMIQKSAPLLEQQMTCKEHRAKQNADVNI